jgi:hypothetical protein
VHRLLPWALALSALALAPLAAAHAQGRPSVEERFDQLQRGPDPPDALGPGSEHTADRVEVGQEYDVFGLRSQFNF